MQTLVFRVASKVCDHWSSQSGTYLTYFRPFDASETKSALKVANRPKKKKRKSKKGKLNETKREKKKKKKRKKTEAKKDGKNKEVANDEFEF